MSLSDFGGVIHPSISEKPTTFRLTADLRARAEDEARSRGWSLNYFGNWILTQFLNLEFLEPNNREFVRQVLRELGHRRSALEVVDALVSAARVAAVEGKLQPTFWTGQIRISRKCESRRITTQRASEAKP